MTIRVYTGFGSSAIGSEILMQELRAHQSMDVLPIGETEMKEYLGWIDQTHMIVFAGKSVGKFKQAIGAEPLERLKHAIYDGQIHYMGICAGAAFAMQKIQYHVQDQDQKKEWISNTGLGLFDGFAKGPHPMILREAFSGTAADIRRIKLYCHQTGDVVPAIHWGGPALIPFTQTKHPDVEVISSLYRSGAPMALKTRFGKGQVFLSSHHPEITSRNILAWVQSSSHNHAQTQQALKICDGIGSQMLRSFLKACDI